MKRGQAVWVVCYAYLVYVFLGELPVVGSLSIFSVQNVSALLVVVYLFSSYASWGAVTATKFLVGTWLASYAIEFVGLATGYPFGHYAYTSAMTPFVGPVPLFIPFSWCALGYFSLRAAGVSILAPACLMAFLDLSFDPIFSRTLWHWQATVGPLYFGVPALNFVGWFITALVIFALFWIEGRKRANPTRRGVALTGGSAEGVGFYFLFGMTNVGSLLIGGLPVAAALSAVLFAASGLVLWISRAREGSPGL